jgi:hypothetical protein
MRKLGLNHLPGKVFPAAERVCGYRGTSLSSSAPCSSPLAPCERPFRLRKSDRQSAMRKATTRSRFPRVWDSIASRWQSWVLLSSVVVLSLIPARPATAATITVGPPTNVPWVAYSVFPDDATLAVLADGSFAIGAVIPYPGEPVPRVQTQFFRADGAPLTRPTILARVPITDDAGIGSVGDRYFLVTRDPQRAYGRFFSEQGAPLGERFSWPYSAVDYFFNQYTFGTAPLWRFLPLTYKFLGYDSLGDPTYQTFLRVADADGRLLGTPVVQDSFAHAAINGSGRFVVISTLPCSVDNEVIGCVEAMQVFDGAAQPLTPLITSNLQQLIDPQEHFINTVAVPGIGPTGQVVLQWLNNFTEIPKRLVARLYDDTGLPLSGELDVSPPELYMAQVVPPIPLRDGSFVFSWLVASPADVTKVRILLRRFDPRSMTFDAPVVLLTDVNLISVLLQVNDQGKGVVVWQSVGQSVYFQLIQVNL